GFWAVGRYAAAQAVSRATDTFSSWHGTYMWDIDEPLLIMLREFMLFMDPPLTRSTGAWRLQRSHPSARSDIGQTLSRSSPCSSMAYATATSSASSTISSATCHSSSSQTYWGSHGLIPWCSTTTSERWPPPLTR